MDKEKARTLTSVLLGIKQICDDLLSLVAKTQVEQPQPQQPPQSLEDLERAIPDELKTLLTFQETKETFIIKPRQFLGTDNFVKIADIIRGLGGQYISAGKESRFEVPRSKP